MADLQPITIHIAGRSGVLTRVDADGPVDVTRLAAEVGIEARVVFSPEVWAYCEPACAFPDEVMNMALRDQHARHILAGLRRHLASFKDGRLVFRSNGARRSARLVAEMAGNVDLPAIEVALAA
jgi:hypothetical protein